MSQYPPEKPKYQEVHSPSGSPPQHPSSSFTYAPSVQPPHPDQPEVPPKKPSLIKRLAPGETPAQLLNPPPACFQRPPPKDLPYPPFPPLTLVGHQSLQKGFLITLPEPVAGYTGPHPFATHDLTEDDWARFIHDVKIASSLAPKDRLQAALIPAPIGLVTGGLGIFIGFFLTRRIESHIKKKKDRPTGELIDIWNQHFFNPRRLHVTLARGKECHSGQHDAVPPDMALGMPTKIDPADKHWRLVVSSF